MAYIDGFVAAVPTADRDSYKVHVEYLARGCVSDLNSRFSGPFTRRRSELSTKLATEL